MKSYRVFLAILLTLVLAACSTPGAPPAAADLLSTAAQDARSIKTVTFSLVRLGQPVAIDALMGATLSEITGEYQAPDKVHARVKAQLGSAVLSVDILWLPDAVYMTNPFLGSYSKLATPLDLNPALLFGADGLPALLQGGLRKAVLVGKESIEGSDCYHIRAEADGAALKLLTAGILVEGAHAVDVWIESATSHVIRLRDSEPGGTVNGWQLDLYAFGKPVEIRLP